MYTPTSVCIAAHNEANTVAQTIESIQRQAYPGDLEIIVCANGCTDDTAEIAQDYSGVQVIETDVPGKPNAWNILRNTAKYNRIVFCDADVLAGTESIHYLHQALDQDPNLIAVTAINTPLLQHKDPFTRLLAPPTGAGRCIIGRLYAFNNDQVQENLQSHGYQEMPRGVIHDDLWLTHIIGKNRWANVPQAEVFFHPYHWRESYRLAKRHHRGIRQLNEVYNKMITPGAVLANSLSRRLERLRQEPGIIPKAKIIGKFFALKALYAAAKIAVHYEQPKDAITGWEISLGSKQPLPNY